MADFSLVMLVGKLTRDPELKFGSGGVPFARLSLAVNRSQARPDGSRKKSVTFVDVTVWRRQAELCAQFLTKGSRAMIVGTRQEQRSTDENGGSRPYLHVVADRVQFLDRRVEAPTIGVEP